MWISSVWRHWCIWPQSSYSSTGFFPTQVGLSVRIRLLHRTLCWASTGFAAKTVRSSLKQSADLLLGSSGVLSSSLPLETFAPPAPAYRRKRAMCNPAMDVYVAYRLQRGEYFSAENVKIISWFKSQLSPLQSIFEALAERGMFVRDKPRFNLNTWINLFLMTSFTYYFIENIPFSYRCESAFTYR